MTDVTCNWCSEWIEDSNLRWPGFCAPACRDAHRADRQATPKRRRDRRRALADRPPLETQ